MSGDLAAYADMYEAGYTQDALKELVEAHVLYTFVRGEDLPGPTELGVPVASYLNGLAEAASELRRFILDLIRLGRTVEGEPYLAAMDEVYSHLITMDFPDALTGGLRRTTDALRGVLERTRGDLTVALRQEELQAALSAFERQATGFGRETSANPCSSVRQEPALSLSKGLPTAAEP
jgi:translin